MAPNGSITLNQNASTGAKGSLLSCQKTSWPPKKAASRHSQLKREASEARRGRVTLTLGGPGAIQRDLGGADDARVIA